MSVMAKKAITHREIIEHTVLHTVCTISIKQHVHDISEKVTSLSQSLKLGNMCNQFPLIFMAFSMNNYLTHSWH